jgi:uncharacterized protein YacL
MAKFIYSAIGSLLVFLLVLALSGSALPTYNESEVLGLTLSSIVYVIVLWIVSVPVVLVPTFAGLGIGATSKSSGGKAIGGCFGLVIGLVLTVLFEVWFLQNAHTYNTISWFPQFSSGQAWAVAGLTFLIGILSQSGNSDKDD